MRRFDQRPFDEFADEMPALQTIGQAAARILPGIELSAQVSRFTESPIETMLAVAILRQWEGVEMRQPGEGFGRRWTLIPQYPWGRYRVDLALRKPTGEMIFIECDGEEFHSTPEQIARDEARQREMTEAGIPVIRFTGAEIYHSAVACSNEIMRRFKRWGQ